MVKILFVCAGNVCRSPMAKALFKKVVEENNLQNQVFVDSAGTLNSQVGYTASDFSVEICKENNLSLENHRAKQITKEDLENFDLIVTMDRKNQENVLKLANNSQQKEKVVLIRNFDTETKTLDVSDPYGLSIENYRETYKIIERCSTWLLKFIKMKFKISEFKK
ncbi:low molecular weight phosphotyrosine protein phosphatase [bacterium]|nr:low molecular weight phosphotyrosine protein phosphatase [bacterium]